MSKLELSKKSGVKRSTIYNIFNEEYNLKLETLRPIAKVIDVSLDYLVHGYDKLPEALSLEQFYLSCKKKGLEPSKIENLTETQIELITNMINEMVNKN